METFASVNITQYNTIVNCLLVLAVNDCSITVLYKHPAARMDACIIWKLKLWSSQTL